VQDSKSDIEKMEERIKKLEDQVAKLLEEEHAIGMCYCRETLLAGIWGLLCSAIVGQTR
jgi:hypothetical protein